MLFFAIILDPRYKFDYAKFVLEDMFGEARSQAIVMKLKEMFYELFNEYSLKSNGQSGAGGSSSYQCSHGGSMLLPRLMTAGRSQEKYKQKRQITGVEKQDRI